MLSVQLENETEAVWKAEMMGVGGPFRTLGAADNRARFRGYTGHQARSLATCADDPERAFVAHQLIHIMANDWFFLFSFSTM